MTLISMEQRKAVLTGRVTVVLIAVVSLLSFSQRENPRRGFRAPRVLFRKNKGQGLDRDGFLDSARKNPGRSSHRGSIWNLDVKNLWHSAAIVKLQRNLTSMADGKDTWNVSAVLVPRICRSTKADPCNRGSQQAKFRARIQRADV